jgi:DNA-binding response OmpR family regulator
MGKKDEILTCCPTCGGELKNSSTLVDLDSNFIMHNDRVTFVTPAQAEILFILRKRMPAVVRNDALINQMYGVGDHPDDAENVLKVNISRANQRIASLGLVIENAWGKGYALRESKKDEVAA